MYVRAYGCIWGLGNLGQKYGKLGVNMRIDWWAGGACKHVTRYACKVPLTLPFPNKVLVLTLLTKCGVVVGVFGLGPKGRGLDSLHLWVPIAGGWFTLQGALLNKFIFLMGTRKVPICTRRGIRGPEGK